MWNKYKLIIIYKTILLLPYYFVKPVNLVNFICNLLVSKCSISYAYKTIPYAQI